MRLNRKEDTMLKKVVAILLALMALLAIGCGGEAEQVAIPAAVPIEASAAPTATPAPEQTPESAPAYVSPYTDKLAALKAENSDAIGWIAIPGTNIDKGILYADGWFYASHNEEKKGIESGAIYTHEGKLTQNIVITAHNARVSKTMFHELHHVQEVNMGKTNCAYKKCNAVLDKAALPDFSTPEGRIWDVSAFGIDAQWEIFAMYETDAKESGKTLVYNTWYTEQSTYYGPTGEAEIKKWIDYQIGRSDYDFGVTATPKDQFMTIYTCGDNSDSDVKNAQSRLYFFLKQVNPVSTLYGASATPAA